MLRVPGDGGRAGDADEGTALLDDYTLLVTQLVTLWAVLDPVGHLPLFLGATAALDRAERRRAAVLAVAIAFGILAGFAVVGRVLLEAMGISLLAFQVAGGIILFLFAVTMVLGAAEPAAGQPGAPGERDRVLSLAVHPLATPIIAGPGAMLTVVLLTDNNRHSLPQQAVTLLALAAILSLMLGVFLLGEPIRGVIGPGGPDVLRRVMGLVLAALAVNMVLSAIALWLHLPGI
jgi:multiple antibiotic resistance protein